MNSIFLFPPFTSYVALYVHLLNEKPNVIETEAND